MEETPVKARKISNAQWVAHLKQLIPSHGKKPRTVAELALEIDQLGLTTGATKGESTAARVRRAIRKLKDQSPGCISESIKEGQAAYNWSETASLSLAGINQEELIAMGVLQHYGTDLVSQRVRRVLEPYFYRAKEEMVDRGIATGLSEPKATKTVDAWLTKVAVLPAVLPFKRPEVNAEVEATIHEALFNQHTLSLRFKNKSKELKKPGMTVSPLGIVQQGVRIYLVALDHYANQVKTFLLHRIASVGPAREEYRAPKGWNLKQFLRKGIAKPELPVDLHDLYGVAQPMKLWVHSDTQWIKETPFYIEDCKPKIIDMADKSFCIKADFVLSEELIRWLISMSYHVRVLEPSWLADRITHDIRKALEMYQEKQ
jgi:predicted DNA-binding transcriptional regulator YafY